MWFQVDCGSRSTVVPGRLWFQVDCGSRSTVNSIGEQVVPKRDGERVNAKLVLRCELSRAFECASRSTVNPIGEPAMLNRDGEEGQCGRHRTMKYVEEEKVVQKAR